MRKPVTVSKRLQIGVNVHSVLDSVARVAFGGGGGVNACWTHTMSAFSFT